MKLRTKAREADSVFKELNLDESKVDALAARLVEEQAKFGLAELCKISSLTQTDLANRMSVSQNRVSQIELADLESTQIDTLRNYIEALGGSLILGAHIDGKYVTITQK